MKAIKSKFDENNNNFETKFKSILNPSNTDLTPNLELKIKIKRKDMFSKAKYEFSNKKVFIRNEIVENIDKFSYYPLFSTIDYISKRTIIEEINPKKLIIFLGLDKQKINDVNDYYNGDSKETNKFSLNEKKYNNNSLYLNNKLAFEDKNSNRFKLKFENKIFNVKFDSSILQKMSFSMVKDFGNIYDLKNSFLKVKTKRNNPAIKEICLIYQDDICMDQQKLKKHIILDHEENEDNVELIYNKNSLKLIEIKNEISKLFNEEILIFGDYLSNKNRDFKLYLKNGDITLEGNYNAAYLKARKFIQDFMSSYNYINEI